MKTKNKKLVNVVCEGSETTPRELVVQLNESFLKNMLKGVDITTKTNFLRGQKNRTLAQNYYEKTASFRKVACSKKIIIKENQQENAFEGCAEIRKEPPMTNFYKKKNVN